MTDELIKVYGLTQHLRMCQCGKQWQPASAADINCFHTDMYVAFLQQLACNAREVIDELPNHILNASVCFTETAWCALQFINRMRARARMHAARPPPALLSSLYASGDRRAVASTRKIHHPHMRSRSLACTRRVYSALYAGGSIAAANALVAGDDVAINFMGGQVHARRDCASGFSYVNDVVLAILTLLRAPLGSLEDGVNTGGERRVLYVNLDGWHASGVEEAFYTTDRVLTISLHRRADGVFPGSGGSADAGMDAGKHHSINLPVSAGLDDEGVSALLLPVLAAAAAKFCPHCIVCSAGAGVLAADRLGCLNVSLDGFVAAITALAELKLPLLVLGGCAFTNLTAAKAWTAATAALCGVELPTQPEECGESLGPLDCYPSSELGLSVPKVVMENLNTPASLEATKGNALKSLEAMTQRTAPGGRTKRPLAAASEVKTKGAAGGPEAAAADSGDEAAVATGDSGQAQDSGEPPAEPPATAADAGGDADMAEGGGSPGAAEGTAPMEIETSRPTAVEDAKTIEERMVAEEPGLGDEDE